MFGEPATSSFAALGAVARKKRLSKPADPISKPPKKSDVISLLKSSEILGKN
jgi:hypothetical protein